jgi:hypothetical protein
LVPVRNGARPEAPEGGHSSQSGTAPELAGAPARDDPPEPDCPEDVIAADPLAPAEAAPEEAAAVEVPDPEAAVEDVVPVAGKLTAPRGFARLVPAPGICAAFCAAAGTASATESSNARRSRLFITSRFL